MARLKAELTVEAEAVDTAMREREQRGQRGQLFVANIPGDAQLDSEIDSRFISTIAKTCLVASIEIAIHARSEAVSTKVHLFERSMCH